MKAGQALSFASIGPGVTPEVRAAFQRSLGRLRENAPPMPAATARAVLEQELGNCAENAFAEFDWTPLAAASIGQVHRARLRDGTDVAVKIQFPGVREAIEADLANHELLATFLGLLTGLSPVRLGVDVRAVAREVSESVRAELDYLQEARNQREFAVAYRGHPFLHVPDVFTELSTARVLTQEYVSGRAWEDAQHAEDRLRQSWAEAIGRFGYGSLRHFHIFNADTHPGNYRFHEDGSVSFLDFGSVCRPTPELARQLDDLLGSAIDGDADRAWQAAVEIGIWNASDPVTPEEALAYWRCGLEPYYEPQPYTVTREVVAAGIATRFVPTSSAANAMRHISSPEMFILMGRMDIGVMSMLAELGATNEWRAIEAEFRKGTPPATEMGSAHWEFIRNHPTAIQHAGLVGLAVSDRRPLPGLPGRPGVRHRPGRRGSRGAPDSWLRRRPPCTEQPRLELESADEP